MMNEKRYTTIDEVISLHSIQNIAISEDGRSIAYEKRIANLKENDYNTHIWIYESNSKNSYPITTGEKESESPDYSPTNNYLSYICKVGEKDKKKNQIFLKTYDQYNGIQVTNAPEGVNKYKWSPDGKGIYYISMEPESEDIKKRKETYGDFEYVDREFRNKVLYYIELEKVFENEKNKMKSCNKEDNEEKDKKGENTDLAERVTDSKEFNINAFSISPDGKKIALVTSPTSEMKYYLDSNIRLLEISSGEIRKLNLSGSFGNGIEFSPDSKKLAYTKTPLEKEAYLRAVCDYQFLEIYDLESDEKISKAKDYDLEITPIQWTSKGLLCQWQDRASFIIGLLSENGEIIKVYNEEHSLVMDVAITSDGENIAYIKGANSGCFELYVNEEKVTNESKLYEGKLLSNKEVITWKTSDGFEIEGVLSTPQDLNKEKKYPLLVVIHGGPTWASFPIHNMTKIYPIEQFVEEGFIVLEPNYRGSSGYGNTFIKANYKNLGLGDYEDVISGVDHLIEKGIADKERVGVMGWSQGGYISAFCATYSDRFKAISVGAGISNWVTYYTNTDITPFTLSYLGETPWNDMDIYAKTSPMTYINTACTPTLIQHGERDLRVPTPNAYELYRGLQDRGIESELVIFKGMGHGPTKPGICRAIMEQNLEWFLKRV